MLEVLDGGKKEVEQQIEISYELLDHTNIVQALSKVAAATGYKESILVRIAYISEKFGKACTEAQTEYQELLEKCCVVDEKGNFKAVKKEPLIKQDMKPYWESAIKAWREKKIVIKKPPFEIYELSPAQLTPSDLTAIKPILKRRQDLHG